jgi:hypothetical protein
MTDWNGFWSYVHADDEAEGGRIARLARDVASQFEMRTGEKIRLFLDRDSIEWGDNWRDRIDEGLASVAFFIPVLTPRYFMSAECRREFTSFARRASDLGVKELLLPLLYVDVPELDDEDASDEVVRLVKTFQRQDWRELRFAGVRTGRYRRGVSEIARRLVEANAAAEEADIEAAARQLEVSGAEDDETLGVLDRMATYEEALPELSETLDSIGQDIELVGAIFGEASAEVDRADSQGKGFAGRLVAARNLAAKLTVTAENIWSHGNDFVTQMNQVDDGIRLFIEHAPNEIHDADSKSSVCEFFQRIREMSESTREGLGSVQGMIDGISPLEVVSRDLRPPLRRLQQGLTTIIEAREITDDWVRLIANSGVDCGEVEAQTRDQSDNQPK